MGTESWSHEFDTVQALRKQARRSRRVRTGFVALVGIVLVALGGWLVYGQRSVIGQWVSGSSATTSVPGSRDRQAAASASREQTPATPVSSRETPAPTRAPAPRAESPAAREPSSGKNPPVVEKAAVQVPPPPVEPEPASPTSPESLPAQEPEVRAIDLEGYRLEAIVWSNNPSSRFAVINGQIVRAGGDLDGLSVTAIEREGVKVRSDEGTGELRFTLE